MAEEKEVPKKEVTKVEAEPINLLAGTMPGQNFDVMLAQAEKFVKFHARIRELALTVTSVADWVNQDGKPYLEWTGSSKVAHTFGVSYGVESPPEITKEELEDEKGRYINFQCAGPISWGGRTIYEIGTGSSRDAFFGKVKGEYLPLSEIDMTDVKKKAMTNWLNRGLKSLLGLSFTWEEIETITNKRINRENVDGVKHNSNSASPESQEYRIGIMSMLNEVYDGVTKAVQDALVKYSEWTNKEGKKFPGKTNVDHLSDKQAQIVYGRIKDDYEAWKAKHSSSQSQAGAPAQDSAITAKDTIISYKKRAAAKSQKDVDDLNAIIDAYLRDDVGKSFDDLTEDEAKKLRDKITAHYAGRKSKEAK